MVITQTAITYGDNNGLSEAQTDGTTFERSSSLAPWGVVIEFETDETIYNTLIYYNPFIHTNVGTVEFGVPSRGSNIKFLQVVRLQHSWHRITLVYMHLKD